AQGSLDQYGGQPHRCSPFDDAQGSQKRKSPASALALTAGPPTTRWSSRPLAFAHPLHVPGWGLQLWRYYYCCCCCCCLESVSLTSAAVKESSMRSGFCSNRLAGITTALGATSRKPPSWARTAGLPLAVPTWVTWPSF